MRASMLMSTLAASLAVVPLAAAHEGDVGLLVQQSRIATGLADDVTGEIVPGVRVFGAELGLTLPGFADEPGFFANGGTFAAGAQVGFNVRKALRTWDGSDFDQVGPETLTLERADGLFTVTTPAADPPSPLAGWSFPFPAMGELDEHPNVFLNPSSGTGIYLLELEMFTNQAGLDTSLPFWIVFNSGLDEEEHELAIEYVEQYILPAPAGMGLLAAAGLMTARRRR